MLRQVGSDTDQPQTGSCQSGSNPCDRMDSDLITAAWRNLSLDELPGGGKFGRIRPIHPWKGLDATIDLNDGFIRIKDPERKYEKKTLNKILINQAEVRLKPNQAVVATFRMRNLNELSNNRQVRLAPNPISKSSAILCRSFSLT